MANRIQETITADLQKAKSEGSLRVDRIREIFKVAVAQAVTEVKGGSGEIQAIAKDTLAAVTSILNDTGNNTQESVDASVAGIVEGIHSSDRTAADIGGALAEIEASGTQSEADFKALFDAVLLAAQRTPQYARLLESYAEVKARLSSVDATLSEKYGDRYQSLKHQLAKFWAVAKAWFAKAKAEVSKPDPVQHIHIHLGSKITEVGATTIQQGKTVRQRLHALLQKEPQQ